MENKLLLLFVFIPFTLKAQDFVPVWYDNPLPDEEVSCYLTVLESDSETLYLARYCEGASEVLFGSIASQAWTECDLPDSLGSVLTGAHVGETLYVYTESGWIASVDNLCNMTLVAKTDGWTDMYASADTLFVYGSALYLDDTLSSSLVHTFVPATNTWATHSFPAVESVISLTLFQDKLYCVGLDLGHHKIFVLEDGVWNVAYVFPDDEYFIAWEPAGDRIYVSSTSYTAFPGYGILSEYKDGDMDSLFFADGNIFSITATDCMVVATGSFTNFGGCDAENLAIFDRATKEIIPTDRGLDGIGYESTATSDLVYVGGGFMYGSDIYSPGVISLPSCEEVSVEEIKNDSIIVFPNPTTEFLYIENGSGKNVRIFSLSEEIYLMANEVDNKKVFDVVNLSSGTYYILIEGKVFSFIKL